MGGTQNFKEASLPDLAEAVIRNSNTLATVAFIWQLAKRNKIPNNQMNSTLALIARENAIPGQQNYYAQIAFIAIALFQPQALEQPTDEHRSAINALKHLADKKEIPLAQFILATYYFRRHHHSKDDKNKVITQLTNAANNNFLPAIMRLIDMFEEAKQSQQLTPAEQEQYIDWLIRALLLGNCQAEEKLKFCVSGPEELFIAIEHLRNNRLVDALFFFTHLIQQQNPKWVDYVTLFLQQNATTPASLTLEMFHRYKLTDKAWCVETLSEPQQEQLNTVIHRNQQGHTALARLEQTLTHPTTFVPVIEDIQQLQQLMQAGFLIAEAILNDYLTVTINRFANTTQLEPALTFLRTLSQSLSPHVLAHGYAALSTGLEPSSVMAVALNITSVFYHYLAQTTESDACQITLDKLSPHLEKFDDLDLAILFGLTWNISITDLQREIHQIFGPHLANKWRQPAPDSNNDLVTLCVETVRGRQSAPAETSGLARLLPPSSPLRGRHQPWRPEPPADAPTVPELDDLSSPELLPDFLLPANHS